MTTNNIAIIDNRLQQELRSFQDIWHGGYYEGDPLDPMGTSSYGILGYMSVLRAIYIMCIKPYINKDSVVLEIGPGRGAWTKTFLPAKEIWCLDALSAEHNKFWEYVGQTEKIKYIHVNDFKCDALPDNTFNYLFSFGALCHVSFDGITEYMRNIYPKLKNGCQCFIMVADYEKYNNAILKSASLNALRALESIRPNNPYKKFIFEIFKGALTKQFISAQKNLSLCNVNEDDKPRPGRWYNAGTARTCDLLQKVGYKIISSDVCISERDPIIHFTKPQLNLH